MKSWCLSVVFALAPQNGVEAWFDALDAARGPRVEECVDELERFGDETARLALVPREGTFAALPLEARRARSALARELAGVAELDAAIAQLADADEVVFANLAALLSKPVLRDARAAERTAALRESALKATNDRRLEAAIAALGRIDHESAARELSALAREFAGTEQLTAVRALAVHPRARTAVVEIVTEAVQDEARVWSGAALAVLLETSFGTSLAELRNGGEAARERAVFSFGVRHPDERVRRATSFALDRFVARAVALGDAPRADRVLAALDDSGFDASEMFERRIELQLAREGGAQAALDLALEWRKRSPLDDGPQSRVARARGDLLAAAASIAVGRDAEAEPFLADAERTLAALRRERWDLRDHPDRPVVDARALDHRLMDALVPTYRAWIALRRGVAPDSNSVLDLARQADQRLLEAQLWVSRAVWGVQTSLDDLFQHSLGPTILMQARSSNGSTSNAAALDVEAALYRAFATVTGGGVPGFEPFETLEPRLSDPLNDSERRRLLEAIQVALHKSAMREIDTRLETARKSSRGSDPLQVYELELLKMRFERMFQDELKDGDDALRRKRGVSRAGLGFAERLREQGRAETARRTAERVVTDLETFRGVLDDLNFSRTLAAAESALGGALMDLNRPSEAQDVFTRALERLRAAAVELESVEDPAATRAVRVQTAGMLTSLAVNANVKMRQPERALEYFEQAYELDQSDFMRVLLACYRARAGRADEALAALADLPVSPNNFYNLACTHALLGQRELALDYLQRDFDELRTSVGARERQKAWAKDDPDLESLRSEPRFQAMVRPATPESDEKK